MNYCKRLSMVDIMTDVELLYIGGLETYYGQSLFDILFYLIFGLYMVCVPCDLRLWRNVTGIVP